MGLVVFSGFAELTVPPTTDRKALVEAIDGLTTGHGTAIGSAMLKGLDAIAEVNPSVPPVGDAPRRLPPPTETEPPGERLRARHRGAPDRRCEQPGDRAPRRGALCGRAPGSRLPDRLRHRQPGAAVMHARSSSAATSSTARGFGGGGGGFGGGRRRFRGFLVADEPTLKAVAEQTGGTYHGAKDADQLSKVFKDLPKEVATQKRPTEVTWILAALGALLAAAARRGLDALEPVPVGSSARTAPRALPNHRFTPGYG